VLECEDSLGAGGAVVHADVVVPPVLASKCSLSSFFLSHPVLMGRHHCQQVLASGLNAVIHPTSELFKRIPLPERRDTFLVSFCGLVNVVNNLIGAILRFVHGHVEELVVD
jgi:hypothetical protein